MNEDICAPPLFQLIRSTTRGAAAKRTLASPILWLDTTPMLRLRHRLYSLADELAQSPSVMAGGSPSLIQPAQ